MPSPCGFGFSLAIRRSPGVSCPMGVHGAEWGLLVWGGVSGVLVFAGETPMSELSPCAYTAFCD